MMHGNYSFLSKCVHVHVYMYTVMEGALEWAQLGALTIPQGTLHVSRYHFHELIFRKEIQ